MFRFIYVIMMNVFRAPYMIPKMRYMAQHPEKYSEEQRYQMVTHMIHLMQRSGRISTVYTCNLLEYLTQRDIQTKNSGVNVRYRGKHRFFKGFNEFIKEKTRRCDNDFEKIERHVFF